MFTGENRNIRVKQIQSENQIRKTPADLGLYPLSPQVCSVAREVSLQQSIPESIMAISLLLEGKARPRGDAQSKGPCPHEKEVPLLFHVYEVGLKGQEVIVEQERVPGAQNWVERERGPLRSPERCIAYSMECKRAWVLAGEIG